MIKKNSVVLYKNFVALVSNIEQDKYIINYYAFNLTNENIEKLNSKGFTLSEQRVREKDILLLSENQDNCKLEQIIKYSEDDIYNKILEAYELLSLEEENAPIDFADLASLIDSDYKDIKCYFLYNALITNFEFELLNNDKLQFILRSQEKINQLKNKQNEKSLEKEKRQEFIKRLKTKKILPEDFVYMTEIESFALGKTDKSKTLSEAGFSQDVEKAHKLLLDTGVWDITKNPFPSRWGLSINSAKESLSSPPQEERLKLDHISYAIDSSWSVDPDDAICFDGTYLWVHIADPASTVMPDSTIDKVARDRGSTLYIPEGASRMLSEECLSDYALGLKEESNALSFRLLLEDNCAIKECKVFKTIVKVKCITYKEADEQKDSENLKPLFLIAQKNIERRNNQGSVDINLPEVHINVDNQTKKVSITKIDEYESQSVVREMMLLAGEGAAHFAFENNIPFPYVSQEAPDIPSSVPSGLAGQLKLVKSMRKRSVGVTPSAHSGLGIGMYSQVTSPLRRYSDLIAHQQLRAFLDNRHLIDKNQMLEKVLAGDESSIACKKAERKSVMHWTLVYLLQNSDWVGEAVCVEKKGNQCLFMIPELAMQTTLIPQNQLNLNDVIKIKVSKIDIPTQNVIFTQIL